MWWQFTAVGLQCVGLGSGSNMHSSIGMNTIWYAFQTFFTVSLSSSLSLLKTGRFCSPQTTLLSTSRRCTNLFLNHWPCIVRECQIKVDSWSAETLPRCTHHDCRDTDRSTWRYFYTQTVKVTRQATTDKNWWNETCITVQGILLHRMFSTHTTEC